MKHNYVSNRNKANAPAAPAAAKSIQQTAFKGEQSPEKACAKSLSGNHWLGLLLLMLATALLPLQLAAQTYSGPFVITQGGTYTGNWESTNSEVPAVEVQTGEPVIIINSNIRGAGYLIKAWAPAGESVNITVRNTSGYGITPTPWQGYEKPRRFLELIGFSNVVVEHCYMENTAGLYISLVYQGDNTLNNTIKIRYNKIKNIDGRVYGGLYRSQFVQLNFRNPVKHAEIAWNEVINEPNNSAVEDNINIFSSQGTSDSPIRIHNNFIKGAYPVPANGTQYSGGGIISDTDADLAQATRHIEAYENHLVNLGNYSMGIAAGNNIRYHHNRAVNSATFPDGTRFNMYTSGLWSEDYYKKGTTFSNSIDHNEVGITAWGYPNDRHDWSENQWASYVNNVHLPGPITLQTEADEYVRWQQKLSQNGIVPGPGGSQPPTGPEPTGTGTISRQYWTNVHGTSVADIPVTTTPNSTSELTLFEAPTNVADNYGQRVRGYITAPVTGQYTFWIAADDKAKLYLSTSEDPALKSEIASAPGWTYPQEWTKHLSQQSAKIIMQAGKRYYIEALMLEGGGGDHLAVGWQLPDATLERPIAGKRLSPYTPAPPVVTGTISRQYWTNVHGTSVADIPVTTTPSSTSELTLFKAPSNVGDNYGQRVRGYINVPATGQYRFWIAADDKAKLYLSTSEDPALKTEIASSDWTYAEEWSKYPSQQSSLITLQAGKRYYIEALMLEGGGGDNLAVGWQLPDATMERPIPGNRLSPFSATMTASATSSAVMEAGQEPTIRATTAYPNPFKDGITIDFKGDEVELQQVVLHNQAGQVVYEVPKLELKHNKLELDLSGTALKAGFYILRYTDSSGAGKSIKVIKL